MALKSVADGVFAETHGSWPPRVVALHGWGRRGADFAAVLDGLDAIAVDLPGFGASPAPASSTGARGYAEILEDLVRGLPEPPVLVGHSFGGRVAVCLAASVPLKGIVLTGVPLVRSGISRRPALAFRALRWANRRGLVSDDRMERERRRRGSDDYRAATGVMRQVLVTAVNESYETELAQISAPVTLVWGAADTEVDADVARAARAILDGRGVPVELVVLDDVGHLVPTQTPSDLRRAIDAMLDR
ncbi:MAG: alpha/beta hydrolase [Acidimicrobiia bacterium]